MRIRPRCSPSIYQIVLVGFLLIAYVPPVFSIPQPFTKRQSSFEALQLPRCALSCFLGGILADGCANETDFACHCGPGNIIGKATACLKQGCDDREEKDAMTKVQAACNAVGGGGSRVGEIRSKGGFSSLEVTWISISTPISTPISTLSQRPASFSFNPQATSI
jgi:hypothetical protein